VHGSGLSTESWGRVPELLADRHRIIAYDLRGRAQSGDARSGGYGREAHDGTRLAVDLDVPTFVLHGTEDPDVPPEDVRALMAALPHGERVQLPGAGHMLPLLHAPGLRGRAHHPLGVGVHRLMDRTHVRSSIDLLDVAPAYALIGWR
jgi:pimeloyl-ACP methyl ester carboxylesterase